MWGSGSEGQLGLGIAECELPSELKFRSKVTSVACGYYHTAVITGNSLNVVSLEHCTTTLICLMKSTIIILFTSIGPDFHLRKEHKISVHVHSKQVYLIQDDFKDERLCELITCSGFHQTEQ